jgi:LysM repeat protein
MGSKKLSLVLSLAAVAGLMIGCSSTKVAQTETKPVAQAEPTSVPTPTKFSDYMVKHKDTLWAIAGKKSIYADNFAWPLIFKSNRDMIQDPDLIYPNQDFKIRTEVSSDDMSNARTLASKTPKFAPHSLPRNTLPVDYF